MVGGSDFNAVSGDMSADITSKVTILNGLSMFSYHIAWNGTSPSGSITFQTSNDYSQDSQGNVLNPGSWNDMVVSGPTDISGDSGEGFLDATQCSAYAIRFIYTRSAGSGEMEATIKAGVA